MIEGVLHHRTDAEIERRCVDSRGQSVVAFAFCRLLGFSLLPRLKAISSAHHEAASASGLREGQRVGEARTPVHVYSGHRALFRSKAARSCRS
jgi:hypothetical protein